MYKCTECQAEYTNCPDFCDCGNDTFEEVYEEAYEEEYYEEPVRPVRRPTRPKRVLTPEEIEEMEEEAADKKKAMITMGIALLICLVAICCPPYPQKKIEKVKEKAAVAKVKLPDVSSYWDNTLPAAFRKGDPDSQLPLLNENFSTISTDLRNYLVLVGEEFSSEWNSNLVDGTGECKIQFTINKDGIIENKKMIAKSRNESLDNAVLLLLSKITNLNLPPSDYKGERIILAFKVDEKSGSKVYYPQYKRKK